MMIEIEVGIGKIFAHGLFYVVRTAAILEIIEVCFKLLVFMLLALFPLPARIRKCINTSHISKQTTCNENP